MQRKQNNFGVKYGNRKDIKERPNGLIRQQKSFENSKFLSRTDAWNHEEQHSSPE